MKKLVGLSIAVGAYLPEFTDMKQLDTASCVNDELHHFFGYRAVTGGAEPAKTCSNHALSTAWDDTDVSNLNKEAALRQGKAQEGKSFAGDAHDAAGRVFDVVHIHCFSAPGTRQRLAPLLMHLQSLQRCTDKHLALRKADAAFGAVWAHDNGGGELGPRAVAIGSWGPGPRPFSAPRSGSLKFLPGRPAMFVATRPSASWLACASPHGPRCVSTPPPPPWADALAACHGLMGAQPHSSMMTCPESASEI